MELLCIKCNKKNLISNRYCYKCGAQLHPEQNKLISYNSVEDFLETLPESSYYKNRIKLKSQGKILLYLIISLIFILIITTAGLIIFLPALLSIFKMV